MPYCTPDDVKDAIRGDQADNGTAGTLGAASLTNAIKEAQGTVDGYLRKWMDTPLQVAEDGSDTPPLVWAITRTIAAYLATLSYRKSNDLAADDPIRLRYQLAMADLEAIAKGDIVVEPPGDQPTDVGEATVVHRLTGMLWEPRDFGLSPARGALGRGRRSEGW